MTERGLPEQQVENPMRFKPPAVPSRLFPGQTEEELPPCALCGRAQAVAGHWRTVPEGGRPDLCWSPGDGVCEARRVVRAGQRPDDAQQNLFATEAA